MPQESKEKKTRAPKKTILDTIKAKRAALAVSANNIAEKHKKAMAEIQTLDKAILALSSN